MQSEFSGRTVLTVNSEGKIDGKGIDGYVEFLNAIFISSADSSVSASFSEAVKLRKKDYIISQAKLFDPRINTIELLSDGLYVGFDGVDQMLPLSMNGVGLSKYLSIVCAAACGAYNVLLVDEIEDGLHYSAYKTLLEALYLFAKNNGTQFFITTHSIETLKYLANLANKNTELRDMTSVYSLCRTKNNGIKVYTYIGGDLADAVEQQIELRGVIYGGLFAVFDTCRGCCRSTISDSLFKTPESLLEKIINAQNQPIFDCWNRFEEDLKEIHILLGDSTSQKKLIKERNRDYSNPNHWNLDTDYILSLKKFFDRFFQ